MAKFFKYLNLFSLPLWFAMMFAPRHPLTERASRSSAIFGLTCVHYLIALGIALSKSRNQQNRLDFNSLEGVRQLLSTPQGTLGAWAHMLALDLFTGAWIYRQCRQLEAPGWVRIPSLMFTLLSGPFGLLLFLVWRMVGVGRGEALESRQ